MNRSEDWAEAISELRLRLLRIVRDPSSAAAHAADAIEDLEHLDRLFRQYGVRKRAIASGEGRRTNDYRIEPGRRGPMLAEYFGEGRQPFKCDRSVHDAIAAAFQGIPKPASVEEITRAARKTTRPDLPDYLVRQCLRFWQSREPALVEKIGTRYTPTGDLTAGAKKAWNELARSGKN